MQDHKRAASLERIGPLAAVLGNLFLCGYGGRANHHDMSSSALARGRIILESGGRRRAMTAVQCSNWSRTPGPVLRFQYGLE